VKQYEAVIKVMEENGGFATLGYLYQHVLKVPGPKWNTKTPFASIRRIVQDERFFFKIRPGLWALKSHRNKLPFDYPEYEKVSKAEEEEFNHTYYQGLLVEIGNLERYHTFVPAQDKNRNFLGKKLGDVSSVKEIFRFGYDNLVRVAQRVDVTWFNTRNMPSKLFEVEHSTDMHSSLLKFVELQDFYADFFIVADDVRRREFETKLALSAFCPVAGRVDFLSYNGLSQLHARTCEIMSLRRGIGL
jgi:hypothetical protein